MARPIKDGLDYFPLDCEMDYKVETLEGIHGITGFGFYIKLLQEIYKQKGGILKLNIIGKFSLWKTLRKKYDMDETLMMVMINDMVELNLFNAEQYKKGFLTSDGIQKRVRKIEERRKTDRKNKKNKGKSYPQRKLKENYKKTVRKVHKVKESKAYNKEQGFSFVKEEFKQCFLDWVEYKQQKGEKYKTQKSLEMCYNKLVKISGNDSSLAQEIINESMANNWKGFFPIKKEDAKFKEPPFQKSTHISADDGLYKTIVERGGY